ncbi:MAG: alpha/beta hydrolase [Candidatus Heimdallarchaeota archaeon]|nr:alpha/beta hydrolase [Candidatus Heimdallarchaeota archaeon]
MDKNKIKCMVILFSITASLITLLIIDRELINKESFLFDDHEGNSLSANYYKGAISKGIMLLEGFGSDQVAIRTITAEFVKLGFHTFTFDFSGHGRSSGNIDFDNAETDRMALQVLDALNQFKLKTGLSEKEIFIVGHSLGARVALQSQFLLSELSAGLILLGTQISLITNTQSEFFTGVTDNDIEWINNLGPTTPETNILLMSGSWDDILTIEAAHLLYSRLSGVQSDSSKHRAITSVNGYLKELVIFPHILHSFEVYSPRIISYAIQWIDTIINQDLNAENAIESINTKIILWLVLIILLLYLPLSIAKLYPNDLNIANGYLNYTEIVDKRRFFRWKFVLWLLALPIMGFITVFLMLLPLNIPVFSLTTLGFISGYGLINFILYKKSKFPGMKGGWQSLSKDKNLDFSSKDLQVSIIYAFVFIMLTTIFSNTGHSFTFPLNERFIWLIIFTFINFFAYLIGNSELVMFYKIGAKSSEYRKLLLLALMPFFVLILFYIMIGSISGIHGAVINFIKYGMTLSLGWLLQKKGKNLFITSFMQSFLLQWLILPQGALFPSFIW